MHLRSHSIPHTPPPLHKNLQNFPVHSGQTQSLTLACMVLHSLGPFLGKVFHLCFLDIP